MNQGTSYENGHCTNIPINEVYTVPVKDGVYGKYIYYGPMEINGIIAKNVEIQFQSGRAFLVKAEGDFYQLEKLLNTDYGADTFLFKAFVESGRELSFGQSQKLATARALFKNAGIIILDEPTSACDAKAEYEIFKNFRQLIKGKTALLISHRLWSCQFCDEIMVLKDKKIVERGTHDQLMTINGGIYRNMFLAQSKYYITQ